MYDIENYYNAETIAEAVSLLKEHQNARIICGGSDVLIKIREGKYAGASLVCIRGIKEIQGVTLMQSGDIYIGAATSFSHISSDSVIKEHIPVLGEAVDMVGGPQIRNIGTIGGNVCNGAVSADSVPTLFSLNAMVRTSDGKGGRTIPIEMFYKGPGQVDLLPGELVTHLVIPEKEYKGYHGHYIKYSMRNAMDIAALSCSVVSLTEDNRLKDVRVTFGVAAPVPFRCRRTEDALKGMEVGEELYDRAAELVRGEINPRDSWRASREFRIRIGGEIAARALKESIERGGVRK